MLDRLLLVRHGEVHNPGHVVYADLAGFGLSAAGAAQAIAAAERLAPEAVDLLWSSPLRRAIETARPIGAALGLPVVTHPLLTEWRLSSRWAPTPWEDLPNAYPGELEAYLATPADLPFAPESIAAVAERIIAAADEAGRRRPGGTAVFVTHQDPFQAARLAMTGVPLDRLNHDKPGHCAVADLRHDGETWNEHGLWHPDVPDGGAFPPPAAT